MNALQRPLLCRRLLGRAVSEMAPYVTVTGPKDGVPAAGRC